LFAHFLQLAFALTLSLVDTPSQNGQWKTWTWQQFKDGVDSFAKALLHVGCSKFDIVNIIGFNSPEWFMANHGAIQAGCVSAGIYATNNAAACKYVSEHSQARVIVVEGLKQLEKYHEISKDLPHLKAIVVYGVMKLSEEVKAKLSVPVYTFDDFCKLGADVSAADLKVRAEGWKVGEVCSLIYTSGTTGPPKVR
jgi:long-chain-fatty-acid--CoA ligase ACSBG